MELKENEKQIIKDFIQALALEWQLSKLGVVRRLARYLNRDTIAIIKLLNQIIREDK